MNGRELVLCSALLGGLASARASGTSFTVNSAADVHDAVVDSVCETAPGNGICTLRAAVEELNLSGETPRQVFLPALTFVISQGELSVDLPMLLQGAGMGATIVRAQAGSNQRFVYNGAGLTLRDLAINEFDNAPNYGGAIRSIAGLVVERCRFENNHSAGGGVIYHTASTLTISDSVFSLNSSSPGDGGAIVTDRPLRVDRSVFESNSSASYGGAISARSDAAIYASVFVDNEGARGGALVLFSSGVVVNSTLHANRATVDGGAVWVENGPVEVFSSTFTANVANSDLEGIATGAAFYISGPSALELSNSILAENYEYDYDDFFKVWAPLYQECAGSIVSNGFNVIKSNSGGCAVAGAVQAFDPLLLPLAYNGGSTPSRELAFGSPARDAGMPIAQGGCFDELGAPVTTDQRGAVRPYGGECDLGAVEHGAMMFSDDFEGDPRWSDIVP